MRGFDPFTLKFKSQIEACYATGSLSSRYDENRTVTKTNQNGLKTLKDKRIHQR